MYNRQKKNLDIAQINVVIRYTIHMEITSTYKQKKRKNF